MRSDFSAAVNVAVRDLTVARHFYGEVRGLKPGGPAGPQLAIFRSGDSRLLIYLSEFAGSNKATAITWSVGAEIDTVVAALKSKGVIFEHYPSTHMVLEPDGDIHAMPGGTHRIAWFKDPDGNILSLTNG